MGEKFSEIGAVDEAKFIGNLSPDYSTISNVRKNYGEQIKRVFKESVLIAMHFSLIGKKLLAGDGTKLRAQNLKKNNYSHKKFDCHLKYIDNKVPILYRRRIKSRCWLYVSKL